MEIVMIEFVVVHPQENGISIGGEETRNKIRLFLLYDATSFLLSLQSKDCICMAMWQRFSIHPGKFKSICL